MLVANKHCLLRRSGFKAWPFFLHSDIVRQKEGIMEQKNCPFTGKICTYADCMIWVKIEEPGVAGTKDMCGIESLIWDIKRLRLKTEEL